MSTPIQDFTTAVDFTVVNPVTADIQNSSFTTLIPTGVGGDDTQGLGLCITTYDTASNVPAVPDVNGTLTNQRWKRYIWIRIPFAGSDLSEPTIYSWNANVIADPTFQNWTSTREDTSPIYTQLASLTTAVTQATSTANSAFANSNTALANASAANTNATNAINSAATATTNANTANTNATTALAAANTASTVATNALAVANAAAASVGGNIDVSKVNPGTAGQQIRVKADGTILEYFNRINTIAILQNRQANGTAGEALTAGAFTDRVINTTISDTGTIQTLSGNQFTLQAGAYLIRATLPIAMASQGANVQVFCYSQLYNVTDAAVVGFSPNACVTTTANAGVVSMGFNFIEAVVVVASAKALKLQSYQINGSTHVTGGAPNGITTEIYTQVTIEKIG